jgi:hypothetical protein
MQRFHQRAASANATAVVANVAGKNVAARSDISEADNGRLRFSKSMT